MNKKWSLLALLFVASITPGCATDENPVEPGELLTRTDAEPAGASCPVGGTAVHTGRDDDHDGVLDDDEIEATTYACDDEPPPPPPPLVTVTRDEARAPDLACPAGSTVHASGLDADVDGVLDDDEIDASTVTCLDASVWQGDFTIDDWLDPVHVAALVLAHEVTGSLEHNEGFTRLPLLERIGGNLHIEGSTHLEMPALREIGGALTVQSSEALDEASFPALERVGGDAYILAHHMTSLDLRALTDVGGTLALGASLLEQVELPVLARVGSAGSGSLRRLGSTNAEHLTLPALVEVADTVELFAAPRLVDVQLPVLQSGGLEIGNAPFFESVSAPQLVHGTMVSFGSLPRLTSVDLPLLVDADRLDFVGLELAALPVLPSLTTVGILVVQDMNRLHDLQGLPALASLDELSVSRNEKLVSLAGVEAATSLQFLQITDDPLLASLHGLDQVTAVVSLILHDCASLPEAEVAAFRTRVGH